jgi:VanZ family protein
VLAYVAGVVLVITLEPFAFRWPTAVALTWWAPDSPWHGWFDVAANVALFLPLGFLAALTWAAGAGPAAGAARVRAALAGGALLSLAVECVQLLEPGRYPSPTDVATNALGAALGAWLHARSERHLGADSPLVGRLALELPVMGLVYVALPLVTLAAVGAGADPGGARGLGLAALGGAGGALLGTVQRRQFGPRGAVRARTISLAAVGWFAAGALPALVTAPRAYGAGALLAGGVAWAVGRAGVPGVRGIERRFEGEALSRAAPWLGGYLALMPLGNGPDGWGRLPILRDLEHAVAFTVLGYVLAEAWGRREWRYRWTAWVVAAAATVAAVAIGAAQSAAGGERPSVLGVAVLAASACWGGWLYNLQRAHVRALVAARAAAAGPADARESAGHAAGARRARPGASRVS